MWEPGRSIVKVPPPPPPKHLKQYHKLENYGHENQNFTASDPSSIYDPVFNDGRPNKPPPPKPVGSNIANVQSQVEEVRDVARANIDRVLKREDKLNDLADRSHHLEEGAKVFNSSAGKLKRKVWWRNFKMWMIIGIAVITIIFIIVVSIVSS